MNIESGNNVQSTIASGASNAPDILKSADRMKYAPEHFKYLADQRMKTFNYYAIVVAASITGSITAFGKCPWQLVAALGVVHLAMAWIFFVIDIRNSRLVFFARKALRHFETACDLDPSLRVICEDHDSTANTRKTGLTMIGRKGIRFEGSPTFFVGWSAVKEAQASPQPSTWHSCCK